MVNPVALLGGAPMFLPAPAWLHDDSLADATGALSAPGSKVPGDAESWWPPSDVDDREGSPATSLLRPECATYGWHSSPRWWCSESPGWLS
jgi:hypothetical protein